MLQKISISNKCSFELFYSQFPQKYEAAQRFSTLIIMRNASWAANQHIRMISEDHVTLKTGGWNDAENSALHNRKKSYILQYIHIENSSFKL